MRLGLAENEKRVGRYEADVVAHDLDDEQSVVVIENQFGRSDHGHLGKSLTYMANLKANTIVWVGESFTDEHITTINALNEITGTNYNFYALVIKAYKIKDTLAYDFEVVAKPNDERKIVNDVLEGNTANRAIDCLRFWEKVQSKLTTLPKEKLTIIKSGRPYSYISFGRQKFSINLSFSVRGKFVVVSIISTDSRTFQRIVDYITSSDEDSTLYTRNVGSRNQNYQSLQWKKDYQEDKEELLEWLVETLERIYKKMTVFI